MAKVRGNESFLLPAAKDKRTAHSWADKAKVKGCEYFVDAPASKERKTLWIFFKKMFKYKFTSAKCLEPTKSGHKVQNGSDLSSKCRPSFNPVKSYSAAADENCPVDRR